MMAWKAVAAVAFCSILSGAQAPPGWMLAGSEPADYDTGVDTQAVYNGQPSAFLKSNKPDAGGFGTLMQYVKADDYMGRRVRFSAFVKAEAVADWAVLWMRVDGPNRQQGSLAFDNMQNRPIKGTTGWQNYQVVLDVPAEAKGIGFGILVSRTGAAWINGVKLEAVGTSVPTTDLKFETPNAPVNLALEGPASGAPRGWFMAGTNPGGYATGVDAQSHSVFLKSVKPKPNTFGTLMQSFKASDYVGKRIRFSASVKSEAVEGWAGLWMRVDGKGRSVAFDNMQTRPIKGTTGWQDYAVVLDAPAEAQGISFGILLNGSGGVSMSGLKLEPVDASVPVTQTEVPQNAPGPSNMALEGEAGAAPRGWFVAGSERGSYSAGVETAGGRPSGYLKSKEPQISGFGTLMQMFQAKEYVGKRVRFNALVRAEAVGKGAGLWMRVDKGSDYTAFDNMGDRQIKGTTGWQSYAVVLDVAPDASAIAFGILLEGTGALWLTDAKFEVVGAEVPTTGRKLAPGPMNLGFEK
jgi:hypothetical protein